MEVKNYLLGYKNMYIFQDTDSFSFSLDSVLLPNFITINKNIKEILDIGCGNAPIPLILSNLHPPFKKELFYLRKSAKLM